MNRIIGIVVLALGLGGPASAGPQAPAVKAQRQEARAAVQAAHKRLKAVGVERHKELLLLRERETSDLRLAKASAARGEALHARILEIHEKSRRDRLGLRERARAERERLLRSLRAERERLAALRRK